MYNDNCIFYDSVGRTPYTCNYFQENFEGDCSNCGKCLSTDAAYVVLRKYMNRNQKDPDKNYLRLFYTKGELVFTHIRGGDPKSDVRLRMSHENILKLCRQIEDCTSSSKGEMTLSVGRYDISLATVNTNGLQICVCIRTATGVKSLGVWEYDSYYDDVLVSRGVRSFIKEIT